MATSVIDIELAIILAKCKVPPRAIPCFEGMTKESLSNMRVKELRPEINRILPPGIEHRKSILNKIIEELGEDQEDNGSAEAVNSVIELDLVVILQRCGVPPEYFTSFLGSTKESLNDMRFNDLNNQLSQLFPPEMKHIARKIIAGLSEEDDEDPDEGQEEEQDGEADKIPNGVLHNIKEEETPKETNSSMGTLRTARNPLPRSTQKRQMECQSPGPGPSARRRTLSTRENGVGDSGQGKEDSRAFVKEERDNEYDGFGDLDDDFGEIEDGEVVFLCCQNKNENPETVSLDVHEENMMDDDDALVSHPDTDGDSADTVQLQQEADDDAEERMSVLDVETSSLPEQEQSIAEEEEEAIGSGNEANLDEGCSIEDQESQISEMDNFNLSSNGSQATEGQRQKRFWRAGRGPGGRFFRLIQKASTQACIQIGRRIKEKKTGFKEWDAYGNKKKRDIHLNEREVGFFWSWNDWTRLSTHGHWIERLDCLDWTWNPRDLNDTLINLFRLLKYCPNIRHISILSDLNRPPSSTIHPLRNGEELSLPNLRSLKIDHPGKMDYRPELSEIIRGAKGKLESIQLISHLDEVTVTGLLAVLEALEPSHLENLKVLSIQRNDEHVALTAVELEAISRIRAVGLQCLDLGFGIWGDSLSQAAFEKILKNFPDLRKLILHGCFVNPERRTEPKIVLHFPKMPHLEVLDMGKNYQYCSMIDSLTERPKKRRRRCFPMTSKVNQDQDKDGSGEDDDDDYDIQLGDGYCKVTIAFSGNMEKMKTLILGNLYEIRSFKFSNMPKLEVFRVASSWHLASKTSLPVTEGHVYDTLKEFQFPDSIQDFSFLSKIPKYFPKIKKLYVNLPTVKFLRAFAKEMQSLRYFIHLALTIQFDFPSSLNSAFLEKPWILPQSSDELEQIRILKEYHNWEDFVAFHRIEVPDFYDEDIEPQENEDQFTGLQVLAKKLRALEIHHVPRRLRLPKGTADWNQDGREFTDTLIGFMEYPISKEAYQKVPARTEFYHFELSQAQGTKKFKFEGSADGYVKLDPSIGSLLVVRKREKDLTPAEPISTSTFDDEVNNDDDVPSIVSVESLSSNATRPFFLERLYTPRNRSLTATAPSPSRIETDKDTVSENCLTSVAQYPLMSAIVSSSQIDASRRKQTSLTAGDYHSTCARKSTGGVSPTLPRPRNNEIKTTGGEKALRW